MAGTRGPVPKRSNQRRRTNAPTIPVTPGAAAPKVTVPRADSTWHKVAKRWYNSLARSGQSSWYEPSDWAVAFLLAESMSRDLNEQVVGITDSGMVVKDTIPLKGASLSAYLRAMSSLLVTEGDRRRASVELTRAAPADVDQDAAVTDLNAYRERFTS